MPAVVADDHLGVVVIEPGQRGDGLIPVEGRHAVDRVGRGVGEGERHLMGACDKLLDVLQRR